MFREFFGLKEQSCQTSREACRFQELVFSFESRGHKSVGMDQSREGGFDTCIDQESWNQQANKEAQEVKGEGA